MPVVGVVADFALVNFLSEDWFFEADGMVGLFDEGDKLAIGFGVRCILLDISLAGASEFFSSFPLEVVVCRDAFISFRSADVEDKGSVVEDSLENLSSRDVIFPWRVSIWR